MQHQQLHTKVERFSIRLTRKLDRSRSTCVDDTKGRAIQLPTTCYQNEFAARKGRLIGRLKWLINRPDDQSAAQQTLPSERLLPLAYVLVVGCVEPYVND